MKQNRHEGGSSTIVEASSAAVSDLEIFRSDCPCPRSGCALHGRCTECRAKHGRKGRLPRCQR